MKNASPPARQLALPLALAQAVLATAVTLAAPANAEDTRAVCLDAAVSGQKLRRAGQLLEAHGALATCAREDCPSLVRRDCTGWLAEDDAATPTIVLAARDAQSRDVAGVQVTIDGRPIAGALDGKEIPLDPGEHTVRFEREGLAPVEQTLVAREREKGRSVVVRFDVGGGGGSIASTGLPTTVSRPVPPVTWALAGVGVVAGAASAYFGLHALSQRSSACNSAGGCPSQSAYDSIRNGYDVSTVALGVAALALGGALWTYLARPSLAVQVGTGSAQVRWQIAF